MSTIGFAKFEDGGFDSSSVANSETRPTSGHVRDAAANPSYTGPEFKDIVQEFAKHGKEPRGFYGATPDINSEDEVPRRIDPELGQQFASSDDGPSFKDQVRGPGEPLKTVQTSLMQSRIDPPMVDSVIAVEAIPQSELGNQKRRDHHAHAETKNVLIRSCSAIAITIVIAGVVLGVVFGLRQDDGSEVSPLPRKVFSDTDELYHAVDLFLVDRSLTLEYGASIGDWDVSRIRVFDRLFDANRNSTSLCLQPRECARNHFNEDLSKWNMSSATSTYAMFINAVEFNNNISTWDMSSVTDMKFMFKSAISFNSDISMWDVSSVTSMQGMFRSAKSFNQPLSNWNVTSLKDMEGLFRSAESFNQPLEAWNVGSVTTLRSTFNTAESFNQPISDWNVGLVTNMEATFHGASKFNQPLEWTVDSVEYMQWMFKGAGSFNQDISNWNVRSVTNATQLFAGAIAFNQNLCPWRTRLPSDASVFEMFGVNTSCPTTADPLLPDGPMCHVCVL